MYVFEKSKFSGERSMCKQIFRQAQNDVKRFFGCTQHDNENVSNSKARLCSAQNIIKDKMPIKVRMAKAVEEGDSSVGSE